MARKNEIKAKLRELGFSEYMLAQFRKQQREYEPYEERARRTNENIMKNGTTTRAYDYTSLYQVVKHTGLVGRDALNELKEEQERQKDYLDNYGLTEEIVSVIEESVKLFNQYNEEDVNFDTALRHIAETYDENELSDVIDTLNEFADFCYKYEESIENGYLGATGDYLFTQVYQILVG